MTDCRALVCVTPLAADPWCSVGSSAAHCTVGAVPPGSSTTLRLTVKPDRKGSLTSSTTATADGLAPVGPVTTTTQVQ